VRDDPNVIGDSTWTGWDHLGEVGTGRVAGPPDPLIPGADPAASVVLQTRT
jgi:hypothetical protein